MTELLSAVRRLEKAREAYDRILRTGGYDVNNPPFFNSDKVVYELNAAETALKDLRQRLKEVV